MPTAANLARMRCATCVLACVLAAAPAAAERVLVLGPSRDTLVDALRIHLAGIASLLGGIGMYQLVVAALIVHEQEQIALETAEKERFVARKDIIEEEFNEHSERLRELKRNADTITTLEIAYCRANFLDNAHEFMAHHQWLGLRKKSIVEVQV